MNNIEKNISEALETDCPFVVYRKPNSNKITALFQRDTELKYLLDSDGKGFVFAPFEDKDRAFVIPFSNAVRLDCVFEDKYINEGCALKSEESEKAQKAHLELVEKGINFINTSAVDKVVLSRKEVVEIDNIEISTIFKKLCSQNQNAFVYAWAHSKTGIWMGATPETLLSVKDNKFNIMALASTQNYNGSLEVKWGVKEIQEHQYVIDYITQEIGDFDIQISDTYTVKAGNLLHLRSDISGELPHTGINLNPLINTLHPTPATCGLPKEESKLFILGNESYDREYYTGYLGELDGEVIELFVNLRCMKVDSDNKRVSIYVGGGITKDSNSEMEWLETVAKTNVIKKVL